MEYLSFTGTAPAQPRHSPGTAPAQPRHNLGTAPPCMTKTPSSYVSGQDRYDWKAATFSPKNRVTSYLIWINSNMLILP